MIKKLQLALLLSLTTIPTYASDAGNNPKREYQVKSIEYKHGTDNMQSEKLEGGKILFDGTHFRFIGGEKKKKKKHFNFTLGKKDKGNNDTNLVNSFKFQPSSYTEEPLNILLNCFDNNGEKAGEGMITVELKDKEETESFCEKIKELLSEEDQELIDIANGSDFDNDDILLNPEKNENDFIDGDKEDIIVNDILDEEDEVVNENEVDTPRTILSSYKVKKFIYMIGGTNRKELKGGKIVLMNDCLGFIKGNKETELSDISEYFIPYSTPEATKKVVIFRARHYDKNNKALKDKDITITFFSNKEIRNFLNELQTFLENNRENIDNNTFRNYNGGNDNNVDEVNTQTVAQKPNDNEAEVEDTQIINNSSDNPDVDKQKLQKAEEESKQLQEKINNLETQIKINEDATNDDLKKLLKTKLKGTVENNTTTDTVGLINLIGKGVSSLSEKASKSEVDMNALPATKEKIEKIIANTRELDQRAKQYEESIHTVIKKNVADNNGVKKDLKGRGLIKKLNTIQIPAENKAKHSHSFAVVSSLVALIIGSLTTIVGKYLIDFLQKKSKNFEETDLQNKEEETEEFFI